MMRIFGLLLMLALFFSCASQKEVAQKKKGRCAIKDSAQYELIVWNRRYAAGDPRINSYIDYSLNRDYGFDFNYKLYMYFRFFEDTNRIKLIPGNRSL